MIVNHNRRWPRIFRRQIGLWRHGKNIRPLLGERLQLICIEYGRGYFGRMITSVLSVVDAIKLSFHCDDAFSRDLEACRTRIVETSRSKPNFLKMLKRYPHLRFACRRHELSRDFLGTQSTV